MRLFMKESLTNCIQKHFSFQKRILKKSSLFFLIVYSFCVENNCKLLQVIICFLFFFLFFLVKELTSPPSLSSSVSNTETLTQTQTLEYCILKLNKKKKMKEIKQLFSLPPLLFFCWNLAGQFIE